MIDMMMIDNACNDDGNDIKIHNDRYNNNRNKIESISFA